MRAGAGERGSRLSPRRTGRTWGPESPPRHPSSAARLRGTKAKEDGWPGELLLGQRDFQNSGAPSGRAGGNSAGGDGAGGDGAGGNCAGSDSAGGDGAGGDRAGGNSGGGQHHLIQPPALSLNTEYLT